MNYWRKALQRCRAFYLNMNWKTSLDKYLTSGPDDSYDNFWENVGNKFSDEFFESHELWIHDNGGQCDKWVEKLFQKDRTAELSAAIIERAFSLYMKNRKTI